MSHHCFITINSPWNTKHLLDMREKDIQKFSNLSEALAKTLAIFYGMFQNIETKTSQNENPKTL